MRAPLTPAATQPIALAREHTVAILTHHFAAGALTMEEFERRVGTVYGASTGAALEALVADLPTVAEPEAAPANSTLSAIFSHTARQGSLVVPRHLLVRVVFGNVELDLRDATFAPGVSEIEISSVFGNVEITVPPGVRVEWTGSALLGSFDSKLRNVATTGLAASDSVLRVLGSIVFSSVEVRG